MPKLKLTNSKKSYLAIFLAIGLFVFFYPHTAIAFDFFDGSWTIIPILKAALKLSGVLLSAAQTIFEWIVVPSNMTAVMDNSAVYEMWRFVRDFFNTTLIMILLFSAFATIFQASTGYHYKKVLLNLVLMALLVNFSYPIARFIIDMSNIFMYGFLNQLGGEGSFWSVIEKSGIHKIITSGTETASPSISYLLAAVIFTFMFAVTMVTIAILLIIRTIALTVFIVFSPIAFLGSTQPGTDLANAASGWWKEFMKYCFSGPIMIFMLVLANKMMIAVTEKDVYRGLKEIAKVHSKDAGLSSLITDISFFSIPLVILWIGITKAQSSGIAGASMVVGQGTKAMKWAGKNLTGYRQAKWVATKAVPAVTRAGMEKFEETVLAPRGLSPTAFIEGWKQRAKDNRSKAISPASGTWRDKFNKLIDGTKTNYGQLEKERIEASRLKELKEISTHSGILLSNGVGLVGSGASTAIQDWRSIIKILYSQRDQDDFMHYIREHYNDPILAGGKSFKDIGIDKDELGVSGWNANQAAKKILETCGDDSEQINKFLLELGEIGGSTKGIGYGGATVDKNGKLAVAKNKWQQAQAAVSKLSTAGDTQAIAKETHRNYITGEGIDPATGLPIINAEFSEMVRKGIPGNIISQVDRHAPTFYQQVGNKETVTAMRAELDKLKNDSTYLNYWDNTANNGEGAVINKAISQDEYDKANKWIDALENFVKTGKK